MKDRSKHILCIEQIVFSHSECVCSAVKGRFGVDELGGVGKVCKLKNKSLFWVLYLPAESEAGGKKSYKCELQRCYITDCLNNVEALMEPCKLFMFLNGLFNQKVASDQFRVLFTWKINTTLKYRWHWGDYSSADTQNVTFAQPLTLHVDV